MLSTRLLNSDTNNSLHIYHQGAHLSSWVCAGREQLFLSQQSAFTAGKAIRGGVPVIFPQFAALGDGPRHGFVRTADWQLDSQSANSVIFSIANTTQTEALWPGKFSAQFCIEMSTRGLKMQLNIVNTGDTDFSFAAALHTYFSVEDVRQTELHGLAGYQYWDNGTDFSQRQTETQHSLRFSSAIDRMYMAVNNALTLIEPQQRRSIESRGFNDVVVWNPWQEGAADLADMADDEYTKMLCVEAAAVDKPIKLKAGESWQGEQIITLL